MAKQTQFATTASLKGLSKGYIPPKDSQCYNLHVPPTSTHMLKTGFQRMKDSAKLVMVRQTKPSAKIARCSTNGVLTAVRPSRLSFLTQCVPHLFVSMSCSRSCSDPAIGQVMTVRKSGGDCKNARPFTTAGAPWAVNMGCQIQANL